MNVLEGPREEQRRILCGGSEEWVSVDGERLVLADGREVDEAEAVYLPPCQPTKILCIHLNYESRRVEFRAPELVTPTYFQKPLSALNAHRGTLVRPADCQYLNYEGEIAAIVGKPMRHYDVTALIGEGGMGLSAVQGFGLMARRDASISMTRPSPNAS